MRPNQQFGQKNIKQGSTNASGQSSLRIFFLVLRYINNETQIYKKNFPISQEEYSLCLIGSFIGLCPIIQQKRRRPDAQRISEG